MVKTEIEIKPRGPFSWEAAGDVGRGFAPVRHHWRGGAVVPMSFPVDGSFTPVAVALRWEDGALRGEVAGSDDMAAVERQVARIFSLDADGTGYPAIGERDPAVGRLMAALPGLRPVCFTSPYETAAWAVISQRITMQQAAAIRDRLVAEHGHPLNVAGIDVRCFPAPERLAMVESVPGLSAEKAERLRGVAQATLDGLLDAETLRRLGDEAGPASVRVIPGIGPFWASGIYLRGAGIQDVYPQEPIAIAALGRLHGLGDAPSPADVARLAEAYRPYRMWVGFLLRVAANRGLIDGIAGNEGGIRRRFYANAR